jgi:Golgi phosphoprotein 3 (GPP34)
MSSGLRNTLCFVADASWPALETLGEDLILLSPPAGREGRIIPPVKLDYGLIGSELVRLVAAGHVGVVNGQIKLLTDGPPSTADPNLVDAYTSMKFGPATAKRWVSRRFRKGIADTYLRQLEAKGVLRSEDHKWLKLFPTTHWFIVDERRAADVRRRLDEISAGGEPIGIEDRALAGLACAVEFGDRLYPGETGKERRERLKQIARPQKPGLHIRHREDVSYPLTAAGSASVDAANATAIEAAVEVAVMSAVDQAVGAASTVAVDATFEAAHDVGGHDGGGGHGGH